MAELRSRSFLTWSLLLIAVLVAVFAFIVMFDRQAFIVMFDRKRESKSEPVKPTKKAALGIHEVNTLAKRIIAKYGQHRVLQNCQGEAVGPNSPAFLNNFYTVLRAQTSQWAPTNYKNDINKGEDSICLENGTIICVSVQDIITNEKNRYRFHRAVVCHGLPFTTMELKIPEKVDNDQYDTAKWVVDPTKLNPKCYTPVIEEELFTSGAVDMDRQANANVLIIGLKAGYLISYLHYTYPKMHLIGVEMEPEMEKAARKWFGLMSDDRKQIYTMDGIKFIENAVKEGRKYDVIILDACLLGIRTSLEFNCPLKSFIRRKPAENISKALKEEGVLLVNVVSFDMYQMVAAEKVMAVYEKFFRECTAIPADESPPSIVVSCTKHDRPEGLKKRYTEFAKRIAEKQ